VSTKVVYLDNREALLELLDEARELAATGKLNAVGLILCGTEGQRSVGAAMLTTVGRERLVMGAEVLIHNMVLAEEEDSDADAEAGDDPWSAA
jgi:hypothetical protein